MSWNWEEVKHQDQRWSIEERTPISRTKAWVYSAKSVLPEMDWLLHHRFHPEEIAPEEQEQLDFLNDRLNDFRKNPIPFLEQKVGNTTYTIIYWGPR